MAQKYPWFKFYPGDWLKDAALRRCSVAARGVWIDMICLMFDSEDRGILSCGRKPWSDQEIAGAVGGNHEDVMACIQELVCKGVADRDGNGAVRCRRMVRDERDRRDLAQERAKAGAKGGRISKRKAKGKQTPKQTLSDYDSDSDSSEKVSESKRAPSVCAEDIDVVWWAYPKRVGKKEAVPYIRAAIGKIGHDKLLQAVQRYASEQQGQDAKYTKHPSRWFRDERWNDESIKRSLVSRGGVARATENTDPDAIDVVEQMREVRRKRAEQPPET